MSLNYGFPENTHQSRDRKERQESDSPILIGLFGLFILAAIAMGWVWATADKTTSKTLFNDWGSSLQEKESLKYSKLAMAAPYNKAQQRQVQTPQRTPHVVPATYKAPGVVPHAVANELRALREIKTDADQTYDNVTSLHRSGIALNQLSSKYQQRILTSLDSLAQIRMTLQKTRVSPRLNSVSSFLMEMVNYQEKALGAWFNGSRQKEGNYYIKKGNQFNLEQSRAEKNYLTEMQNFLVNNGYRYKYSVSKSGSTRLQWWEE